MAEQQTTISIKASDKADVESYRDKLAEEFGTEPTLGETCSIAVERATEWDERGSDVL